MELERDQFVVSYISKKVSEQEILAACKISGFPATIVDEQDVDSSNEDKVTKEFKPPAFYSEALTTAKKTNKPLVLDFTASWCFPCQRIVSETFVDENVAELLSRCILLKIDTDEFPEMAKHFKVAGLPDIRFLNQNGQELKKLTGFQAAEPFAIELKELLRSSTNQESD